MIKNIFYLIIVFLKQKSDSSSENDKNDQLNQICSPYDLSLLAGTDMCDAVSNFILQTIVYAEPYDDNITNQNNIINVTNATFSLEVIQKMCI
jgi:hypothetical protein